MEEESTGSKLGIAVCNLEMVSYSQLVVDVMVPVSLTSLRTTPQTQVTFSSCQHGKEKGACRVSGANWSSSGARQVLRYHDFGSDKKGRRIYVKPTGRYHIGAKL